MSNTKPNLTPNPDPEHKPLISAVILAGGRALRMAGADKGLLMYRQQSFIAHICAALQAQSAEIIINANRNQQAYRQFGYAVISDQLADYQGPLAGIHAAMQAAAHPWLLTIPCDGPLVASDYAEKMLAAVRTQKVPLAVAHDGTRLQPVYALLNCHLAGSLLQFLQSGQRKIDKWYQQHQFAEVDFSTAPSMFTNINTREQLAELQKRP